MKILAITSCPNGIAHTYMAQEKLEQAAKDMGVDINSRRRRSRKRAHF